MKKIVLIVAILMSLGGCAVQNSTTKTSAFGEMSGKKSYGWLHDEAAQHAVQNPDPEIRKQVQSAVEAELNRKGYQKTTGGQSDLLITWFGKSDEKVKVQEVDHFYRSYGYGALAAKMPMKVKEGAVKTTYLEGTLVLDVVDATSKDLLWRGSGSKSFPKNIETEELKQHIRQVVREIMRDFPQQ